MTSIHVDTVRPYDILIDRGTLPRAGEILRNLHAPCKVAIITDDIVKTLYGKIATESLEKSGFEVHCFAFPNGELSKNLGTFEKILCFLSEADITRSDIVLALGGGVVGDLAGFAAASYLRGIDYIQVPTTLIAAVDSSVGGKTGLNLPTGKNLCGIFHQPSLVLIDCDCLATLPKHQFADGISEAIKYGLIADESLFELIKSGDAQAHIDEIVTCCVQLKAQIVAEDEFDTGRRRLLNFGHTFGHAIERCSGYSISHGHAVGIGMVMSAKGACSLGISSENFAPAIENALKMYNLPTKPSSGADKLVSAMLSDKKRLGDTISLILPERIGLCRIHDIPVNELSTFVNCAIEER